MWKIYYTDITPLCDSALFAEKLKLVDAARQEKIARFKSEADKRRSLAAGLLLRQALMESGLLLSDGIHPVRPMRTGPYGKYIYDDVLDFNLSHSGDFAAAVVADCPVGIDVEELKGRMCEKDGMEHMEPIMERSFNEGEISYVKEPAEHRQRAERFTCVWTKKEACAKAYGQGLMMDFRTIDTQGRDGFYSIRLKDYCWLSAYADQRQEQPPRIVEEEICMMN